ncbi:MAG: ATP-binding cassette domain-containing protein [Balneolaceae bacterium]|nr:ATP-binding cassette domain-containing protein [Balneolaceae bacterium]
MISAHNISKSFDENQVLKQISLEIPQGSTVSLIGPSGCGKSTLLRIMIGLVKADTGSVRYNETEISESNINSIRHNIGYVIQEGGLFPHLTNAQNIALAANYLGWAASRIQERIEQLRELVNIESDILERQPEHISGGQRQRISLMRALMLDPEYILMDEPLGSIDPLVRYELQNDLKRIFRELNKTVVLVTHDLGEAAFLGDTIALMRAGKIIQRGDIKTIMEAPANRFVEEFITAQRSPLADLK